MKVVLSAIAAVLHALVETRSGRDTSSVMVDTSSGQFHALNNRPQAAMQGGGVQTVGRLAELGVHAVLTGRQGRKLFPFFRLRASTFTPGLGDNS